MVDAGLKPADIDGIATAGATPVTVAHYLGLTPKWVDGTAVGGCSFMIQVRHAATAIVSEPLARGLIKKPLGAEGQISGVVGAAVNAQRHRPPHLRVVEGRPVAVDQ